MPIYYNDSTLLCVGDNMAEEYKDYIKKEGLKKMEEEANREDVSKEEFFLYNIISSCECILDDMENGANIEEKDMQDIIYADDVLLNIYKRVGVKLNPSNINT